MTWKEFNKDFILNPSLFKKDHFDISERVLHFIHSLESLVDLSKPLVEKNS